MFGSSVPFPSFECTTLQVGTEGPKEPNLKRFEAQMEASKKKKPESPILATEVRTRHRNTLKSGKARVTHLKQARGGLRQQLHQKKDTIVKLVP